MSVFTVGWILWLVWFAVEEGLAFLSPDSVHATFSAHIWAWFAVKDRRLRFRRIGLLVFLIWLTLHLTFGILGMLYLPYAQHP